MANGNNRYGAQPRAHFQLAGGSTIKFKHPYLAGQLDTKGKIDEIDVSSCVKLEGRFFEANPNQDSARQTVLIDGSVVTITNRLLNGTISMPVVRTTGIVATGDFISALQLVKSVGDTVGGLIIKTDYISGKAITRVYYGVTPQRVPDDVSEGNDVPVYNVQLFYAGWIEAVSETSEKNIKKIWAVGTKNGIEGFYSPYQAQNTDGKTGTGESYMTNGNLGITSKGVTDDGTADVEGTVLEPSKFYVDTQTAEGITSANDTVNPKTIGTGIPKVSS